MNIPCRSCTNLSSCISRIIDEGNKWYEEDSSAFTLYEGEVLQECASHRMSDESVISWTFDQFKESIIELLKDKCIDFADYISKKHSTEHPEEYDWEERIEYVHVFFQTYYPSDQFGFDWMDGIYPGECIECYNDEDPKHNNNEHNHIELEHWPGD